MNERLILMKVTLGETIFAPDGRNTQLLTPRGPSFLHL